MAITYRRDGAVIWVDAAQLGVFQSELTSNVYDLIRMIMGDYGDRIIILAQSNTPIRTGALFAGYIAVVGVDDEGNAVLDVNNDVFYFQFIEYGTRYIYPRQMLEEAVDKLEPAMMEEVALAVEAGQEEYV